MDVQRGKHAKVDETRAENNFRKGILHLSQGGQSSLFTSAAVINDFVAGCLFSTCAARVPQFLITNYLSPVPPN